MKKIVLIILVLSSISAQASLKDGCKEIVGTEDTRTGQDLCCGNVVISLKDNKAILSTFGIYGSVYSKTGKSNSKTYTDETDSRYTIKLNAQNRWVEMSNPQSSERIACQKFNLLKAIKK